MDLKKITNDKNFQKNLKKAQTILTPYVDLILCFTEDEEGNNEVSDKLEEWMMTASTVLAQDLNMDIEDVFPQNLADTMLSIGLISQEDFDQMMDEENS